MEFRGTVCVIGGIDALGPISYLPLRDFGVAASIASYYNQKVLESYNLVTVTVWQCIATYLTQIGNYISKQ